MAVHLPKSATAVALALSVGLLALPACKKKSPPTVPDTPAPGPTQQPSSGPVVPAPNAGSSNTSGAPRGPFFQNQATPLAAQQRLNAQNNFKKILIAMHSFEVAYGAFPAGYADKTGKPGLSWRVAILPFLEEQALFQQFKVDEPWDSPNNIKLVDRMPKVFAPPGVSTNGYTFTRGFTGPNTWLPPQQPGRPGQLLLGVKMLQISDGTSNTALVADAADAVIWSKPEEMAFAPNSVPKLGGVFESGTTVGLADGSTRLIRKNADPGLFPKLIQINDGQIVQIDE